MEATNQDHPVVCGHLDVWLKDPVSGLLEIAYGVLPDARRKGHCRRAIDRVINVMSQFEGIRAIEAQVRTSNYESIGLLTGLGFECVGQRSADSVSVRVYRLTFSG